MKFDTTYIDCNSKVFTDIIKLVWEGLVTKSVRPDIWGSFSIPDIVDYIETLYTSSGKDIPDLFDFCVEVFSEFSIVDLNDTGLDDIVDFSMDFDDIIDSLSDYYNIISWIPANNNTVSNTILLVSHYDY